MASYGSMVLSIGTIIGCLLAPWLAERLGRRKAMALYFASLGVAVAIAFGYVFYQPSALTTFFVLIFFLGIGGANFALYTLWLPEQVLDRTAAPARLPSSARWAVSSASRWCFSSAPPFSPTAAWAFRSR